MGNSLYEEQIQLHYYQAVTLYTETFEIKYGCFTSLVLVCYFIYYNNVLDEVVVHVLLTLTPNLMSETAARHNCKTKYDLKTLYQLCRL